MPYSSKVTVDTELRMPPRTKEKNEFFSFFMSPAEVGLDLLVYHIYVILTLNLHSLTYWPLDPHTPVSGSTSIRSEFESRVEQSEYVCRRNTNLDVVNVVENVAPIRLEDFEVSSHVFSDLLGRGEG